MCLSAWGRSARPQVEALRFHAGQKQINFRNIEFSAFIHRPGIKKQTKGKHDVSES
jgi:hypothetical protein